VDGRYQRATDLLTENREILDRISVALLEKETISSEELDRLIAGESDPEETNSSESQPPTAAAPLEPEAKDEKETPKPAPGLRPGLAGV
jgi:cell division protease FtsH